MDLAGIGALAERHATPFYLYDLDEAVAHARRLRAALPSTIDLYYAVKANPNRRVVAALAAATQGLDISSTGELRIAAALGCSTAAMSFAGPGKTDQEIAEALAAGLGILSVESRSELRRAERIAARLGLRAGVTIRINPASAPREFPMRMGGGPSQFGIAEEEADEAIAAAKASPSLLLRGFHVFAGTNCLEAPAIVENARQTLAIARRLAARHEIAPEVVNLGGGFGIPYFPGQEPLDGEAVARAVGEVVEAARREDARLGGARFILELGRFLIGAFGVYVTRVVDVKETRGKRYAILDGGMHHCFPATGNFGQLIKKNYPVRNLSREGEGRPHELVGPLCTPIDSMGRSVELPRAEEGDLVAFLQCGAYAYTASPLQFLSHDTPAELCREGGAIDVARERARTA